MKTIIIVAALLTLTGCATKVPVAMKFPAAPESLLITCAELEQIPDNEERLTELAKVVVNNYSQYHACRSTVDAWINWYNEQKKISDSVIK